MIDWLILRRLFIIDTWLTRDFYLQTPYIPLVRGTKAPCLPASGDKRTDRFRKEDHTGFTGHLTCVRTSNASLSVSIESSWCAWMNISP
jgi:hypothetical protein